MLPLQCLFLNILLELLQLKRLRLRLRWSSLLGGLWPWRLQALLLVLILWSWRWCLSRMLSLRAGALVGGRRDGARYRRRHLLPVHLLDILLLLLSLLLLRQLQWPLSLGVWDLAMLRLLYGRLDVWRIERLELAGGLAITV